MKNKINQKARSFVKRIFLSLLAVSLLTLPLQAYEDHYGRGNSINAGFRLMIPFGPVKQNEDRIKYGLQMSFRREVSDFNFRNDGHMSGPRTFNGEIMSLNFSENGFKSLSLAGQDRFVYQDSVFRAAENSESSEEEGGMNGWVLGLIIGAGVVAVGVGVLAIVVCEKNGCDGS